MRPNENGAGPDQPGAVTSTISPRQRTDHYEGNGPLRVTHPPIPSLADLLVDDHLEAAVTLGVALVQLPDDHPVIVAVRAALELRAAARELVEDTNAIRAHPYWTGRSSQWVPFDELQRRRAEPGPLARRTA